MRDITAKYPIWDCLRYYDKDTMVTYNHRLCYASGIGIEPEPIDYSKEEIMVYKLHEHFAYAPKEL